MRCWIAWTKALNLSAIRAALRTALQVGNCSAICCFINKRQQQTVKRADIPIVKEPTFKVQNPHDLSEHLPFLICQVSDLILLKAQKHYRGEFGLGIREWRVLTLLGLFGRCSAADMVGHASVDKTTISRALDALENKGYVQRIQDPNDARRVEVQLTQSGCDIHDEMVPQSRQRAKNLENAISANERKQLVVILRKLKSHLDTKPF